MLLRIFSFLFFFITSFELFALDNRVIVASTTSTYDTGLLSYLNNYFEDFSRSSVVVRESRLALGSMLLGIATILLAGIQTLLEKCERTKFIFVNL